MKQDSYKVPSCNNVSTTTLGSEEIDVHMKGGESKVKVSTDTFRDKNGSLLASPCDSPMSDVHDMNSILSKGNKMLGLDGTTLKEDHHTIHLGQNNSKTNSKSDLLDANDVRTKRASYGGNAGVLRYALHLRFICPALKSGQQGKEMDLSLGDADDRGMDQDKKRRFYLYSDLRVVFPQRHSDSDEGKVKFELHLSTFWKCIYVCMYACM